MLGDLPYLYPLRNMLDKWFALSRNYIISNNSLKVRHDSSNL